ncbi:MAG: bacteriocin family protein [Candidatus Thermoplasmatota archaeon]|nr:bacteriocin family protein [Candidatus Thermoplasmatota archaeon]
MALTAFERAAQWLDKQMVPPLRAKMKGRRLFAKTVQLDRGKSNVVYNTITDMADAYIEYEMPQGELDRDMIRVTPTTVRVPKIVRPYLVPRDTFESFRTEGIAMDTEAMISAAYKVAKKEDAYLVQGWAPDGTNYEINGLYQGAGTTEATAKDFGTFGNATSKVGLVMAALAALDIDDQNYNLGLNPVQYQELRTIRSTYDLLEWPDVLEQISPNDAQPKAFIYQSNNITAGTGLMTPVDTQGVYMDLLIGQDATNRLGFDSKLGPEDSPIYGHVIECIRPRIKTSTALVKATGI